MIKKIAAREEGRGRKVKVSYGKLWVDGVWWKWSEEEEVIRDWRGISMGEEVTGGGERLEGAGKIEEWWG